MNKKADKVQKKTKKNTASNSNKIKKLNEKLKSLNNELTKTDEKHLRLLADFENFKKRSNKSMIDSHNSSIEKIVQSFLPIIDDLERILNDKSISDIKVTLDGISMVGSKFRKILNSYDVESFISKGEVFNPEFHEAIMSQNSKEKENIIIEEFEKGYKLNDKIIRHSKVIVSKGKKWEIIMKF